MLSSGNTNERVLCYKHVLASEIRLLSTIFPDSVNIMHSCALIITLPRFMTCNLKGQSRAGFAAEPLNVVTYHANTKQWVPLKLYPAVAHQQLYLSQIANLLHSRSKYRAAVGMLRVHSDIAFGT